MFSGGRVVVRDGVFLVIGGVRGRRRERLFLFGVGRGRRFFLRF